MECNEFHVFGSSSSSSEIGIVDFLGSEPLPSLPHILWFIMPYDDKYR